MSDIPLTIKVSYNEFNDLQFELSNGLACLITQDCIKDANFELLGKMLLKAMKEIE